MYGQATRHLTASDAGSGGPLFAPKLVPPFLDSYLIRIWARVVCSEFKFRNSNFQSTNHQPVYTGRSRERRGVLGPLSPSKNKIICCVYC